LDDYPFEPPLINIHPLPIFYPEITSIPRHRNPVNGTAHAENRSRTGTGNISWYLLIIAIALAAIPAAGGTASNLSAEPAVTAPHGVQVGIYIVDFNRFSVATGTVEADFYLTFKSDTPVSINDFELINGRTTSVDTILDTPLEKEYRINAELTVDPDLRRYPFDRHTIPIEIEPKFKNEQELVLVIDPAKTRIDPEADLPGWEFIAVSSAVTNKSYVTGEIPYSRVIFDYGIRRDVASTILKFFLPILLLIIVSLSSLLMKTTSRLGLNASMLLAAVMIHWRVVDAIPLVAYTTFLDLFMIITYGTLVMVLISGIFSLKFMEIKDTARAGQINRWSLRIIPPLSITLYSLLFLSLFL
jgi:hypothetical protein